jgi:hypothetical protein
MHRRKLLGVGAAAGAAVLAGCSVLGGESQETLDAIEAASEDLLAANDELGNQFDAFEFAGDTVSFDRAAVLEHVDSAREKLDTAEANAQEEESMAEIGSLRSFADHLEAMANFGARFATAHGTGMSGLATFGEDYETAIQNFEDARHESVDAAEDLDDAEAAFEEMDGEAMTHIELNRDAIEDAIATLRELQTGYEFMFSGLVPFAKGDRRYEEGDDAFGEDGYGSAETAFTASQRFFESVPDEVDGYADAEMPQEATGAVSGIENTARMMAGLSGTRVGLTGANSAVDTGFSYIDTDRFEDATGQFREADDEVSAARDAFEDASSVLSEVGSADAEPLTAIEVENRRDEFDQVESYLETYDHLTTGLVDYGLAFEAFAEGTSAGDAERYAEAARKLDEASGTFGDAAAPMRKAEDVAPSDLRETVVDLVCVVEALQEASGLYADGYEALDAGDTETARQKFDAGDRALEQCDSDGSAATASAGVASVQS